MPAIAQTHADERITRLTVQRIMHDFGALLAVTALDNQSFEIMTPFWFTSGEMFPLVIETRGPGWRITDRGRIVESGVRQSGELTDLQTRDVARVVRAS